MLQISPQRYQSARGALQDIGEPLENIGERALIVGNKTALSQFEDVIRDSLKESMIGVTVDVCLGACCSPEIKRLAEKAKDENADMILGLGAGKVLDVSKFVGERVGIPVITVPTVASSAAAFTNLAYLYDDDGEFIQQELLDVCPELVVIDYKVVGLADSRYLAAGMGGALSNWYQCSVSLDELQSNRSREVAYVLSEHIKDTILERGPQAIEDVKLGEVTTTVESIVEANVLEAGLVSCLGGSKFRNRSANLLAHELKSLVDEDVLFGEIVAYGLIVHEQTQTGSVSGLKDLLAFMKSVDLPLTLDSLGISENQRQVILEDASETVVESIKQRKDSSELSVTEFVDAINRADEIGQTVVQSGVDAL